MILTVTVAKLSTILPFFAVPNCVVQNKSFFGLPHWWKYLGNPPLTGERDLLNKCVPAFSFPGDIWAVVFAIIDMLLRIAGIAAVIFVIAGGVAYMLSQGNPEKAASARRRIINAFIGLAIVLIASALVSFIGNSLKDSS